MKQTINFSQFHDASQSIRPDNFSYDGLRVLFDWFTELDESCGTETELDVIAICCDFNESTADEIIDDYSPDELDEFSLISEFIDYLSEQTSVCGETEQGTIVYQCF